MSATSQAARLVLFNPGTGMFVQQTGRALHEAGLLKRFVTTLVDHPDAFWRAWLPAALDRLLRKRRVTEFPTALVRSHPPRELLRLLMRELDRKSGVLTDAVWKWSEYGFDRWVARHALDGATGVYGFGHACRETFVASRRRGLTCIYDVPAPEAGFCQRVRDREIAAFPDLDSAYEKHLRATHAQRCERQREEFEMAQLVIANSEFSKSTYRQNGLDVSKVSVIPLGAPPVCPEEVLTRRGAGIGKRPLRFLSVSAFTLHKGSHHLLMAWRKLNPGKEATLQIAGRVSLPKSFFHGLEGTVFCEGHVPRHRMTEIYREADVLVFPSLCDGFGMVVTEALSQGLPVITTPQAGASQLIMPDSNGFVVPAGDSDALAASLGWCLTHREELAQMNWRARETAARWQWSDFRAKLTEEISARLPR